MTLDGNWGSVMIGEGLWGIILFIGLMIPLLGKSQEMNDQCIFHVLIIIPGLHCLEA